MSAASDVWGMVLNQLSAKVTTTAINTWFTDCEPVDIDDHKLVLRTTSELKKAVIAKRFSDMITSALCEIFSCGEFELLLLDKDQGYTNGEDVPFTLSESKDEIPHTITQAEKMQLLKYEEEKRKSTWASKPKIPKYDHPWSGRLTITIIGKYKFSDCKSYSLEERIGEMMIAFYEASYAERLKRLEAEEKRRKEEEERRRAEEKRARRNKEIDYTEGLINAAEDYDSACKLRAYIAAMKAAGKASEEWIEWATAKANWLDPTIRAEDPYFGVREHEQSEEYKKLKKKGYWY